MKKRLFKKINKNDFKTFLGLPLPLRLIQQIKKYNLKYKNISEKKNINLINQIINIIITKSFGLPGYKYKPKWERGWGENFLTLKKKFSNDAFVPGYSDKFRYARLGSKLIETHTKNFVQKTLHLTLLFCYEKFLKKYDDIVDFGCGTGHTILYLNKFDKIKNFYGLDWSRSSQKIFKIISKKYPNIKGSHFDFFNPKTDLKLKKNSWAAYTTHSMEQTGTNYKKFYNFLKRKKPGIIVNIEPIPEILNQNNLLDNLSIHYMNKRKYLNGYLNFLIEEEKKKRIKIILKKKSYFGSFLIYEHSLIIWKFC
jgi:SAM-dependent methyltransferase